MEKCLFSLGKMTMSVHPPKIDTSAGASSVAQLTSPVNNMRNLFEF